MDSFFFEEYKSISKRNTQQSMDCWVFAICSLCVVFSTTSPYQR